MTINFNKQDKPSTNNKAKTLPKNQDVSKAFVLHAERIMQWGALEYQISRFYQSIVNLTEQCEDGNVEVNYTFGIVIQRIDFNKSFNASGNNLNSLIDLFNTANVYLTEQINTINKNYFESEQIGRDCISEEYSHEHECWMDDEYGFDVDASSEYNNGYLRTIMYKFTDLCERLGDIINLNDNYNFWQNVSVSIMIDGKLQVSDAVPISHPFSMASVFEKITNIIENEAT